MRVQVEDGAFLGSKSQTRLVEPQQDPHSTGPAPQDSVSHDAVFLSTSVYNVYIFVYTYIVMCVYIYISTYTYTYVYTYLSRTVLSNYTMSLKKTRLHKTCHHECYSCISKGRPRIKRLVQGMLVQWLLGFQGCIGEPYCKVIKFLGVVQGMLAIVFTCLFVGVVMYMHVYTHLHMYICVFVYRYICMYVYHGFPNYPPP